MIKIIDHKIWRDGKEIGWIEGGHIRSEDGGGKLGYYQGNDIFNEAAHKVAYIKENGLYFENGNTTLSLDHVNQAIAGTDPLIVKCAVYVLFEE